MERIPEPELMEGAEQAAAYAGTDFSEPHDAFVKRFETCFSDFAGRSVADLGCGPADVTLRFARRYPRASIVGYDGAESMLVLGRGVVQAAGLASRIRLERVRLPDATLPGQAFDAVISNSLLHHLHHPEVLWNTLRQVAKPGAAVLVQDLMRPHDEARVDWLSRRYVADAPELLRHDFSASLRAAFTPEEVRTQLDAAGLAHFRVRAVSDRHLLVSGYI